MTYKQNITAILECYFAGFKEEIIDSACNRILEQELDQESYKVSKYDKDHIWYKGNQYISLRRFLEVKAVTQQEPKTGHWIEVIDEIDSLGNKTWHHKCSICGNEDSGWGDYKYCPNCGAKMEVSDGTEI